MAFYDLLIPVALAAIFLILCIALRQVRRTRLVLQEQVRHLAGDCVRIANTELQENRQGRASLIDHMEQGFENQRAHLVGSYAMMSLEGSANLSAVKAVSTAACLGECDHESTAIALLRSLVRESLSALPSDHYRIMADEACNGVLAEILVPMANLDELPECVIPIRPLLAYAEWDRVIKSAGSDDPQAREARQDIAVDRLWEAASQRRDSEDAYSRAPLSFIFVPSRELYVYLTELPMLCEELQREQGVVFAGPHTLAPLILAVDRAMRCAPPATGRPILRAVQGGI